MALPGRKFGSLALLLGVSCGTSFAARPFQLTTAFDIGGGGCIGETRIYEESTVAAERGGRGEKAIGNVKSGLLPWNEVDRLLTSELRYFLTTVGCGADQVAISLDGKAYLLEAYRVDAVGVPITYYSDTASSPRVRIERVSTLHAIEFKRTDCTQRFERVRVRIEFNDATTVVSGVAINTCP